jgi:hypothetical protein
MQLIYSTKVPLFFNTIPEHIDAFVPSWHEFKNSVAVEIGLLHSQPLTNSHFHFFIIVESATSQVLLTSAICYMLPLPSATTYRKTKCLIYTKVTGQGTLLVEHPS